MLVECSGLLREQSMNVRLILLSLLVAGLGFVGCKDDSEGGGEGGEEGAKSHTIAVDGSSTVFPITEAVAEEFGDASGHKVNIGVSGTGGGFKKFCRGELDVTGASRPIAPEEVEKCKEAGVEYIELPIAYDGLTVVVNPGNEFVDAMTVKELHEMWALGENESKTEKWSEIRDGWPDKEFSLYGAGTASGTFDYFVEAIIGEDDSIRGDFTSSEDDNVLVQGVANDPMALGFFGFAYYEQNKDQLTAVAIKTDADAKAVEPTRETIVNGTYQPLTRPLFIYVSKQAADENPAVPEFVEYFMTESEELIEYAGYIPLPKQTNQKVLERFERRKTGTLFDGEGAKVGVSVSQLIEQEKSGGDAAAEDKGEDKAEADGAVKAGDESGDDSGDDAAAEESEKGAEAADSEPAEDGDKQ
jgi:phosphate transport system substrate-binding protein